ncbi:MAG TPA: hypothetical protein VF572_04015 [Candidatus Saccharimonadales bacterium]
MSRISPEDSIPSHYPYVTRSLLKLFDEGELTNVTDVIVEPEYGYVSRISYKNGTHRITYGNDLGLNASAASDLAKDKGHTKFMLRAMDVNCPDGQEFLLPWWAEVVRSSTRMKNKPEIKTTDDAGEYIENEMGYPVYVKPVDGSKGKNVFKIDGVERVRGYICEV